MAKVLISISIFLINSVLSLDTWYPCKLKETVDGFNCVCTEDGYCDTLDVPEPVYGNRFVLITSSMAGERFNYTKLQFGSDNGQNSSSSSSSWTCPPTGTTLKINRRKHFLESRIFGFGGAFTGTVSHILNHLSPKLQQCFYNSYFAIDEGLRYTLMRIPIGCSDFDIEKWAYNLTPENDKKLSNFTQLSRQDRLRNQQIKQLKSASGNGNLQIIGCAWSPPPWMKSKNQWNGRTDNQLKPEYYQTWANYLTRWARLMIQDGIPIWGLSTGNEPLYGKNLNDSALSWKPNDQARWFDKNLRPAMDRSRLSNLRIIGYDDHRGGAIEWLNQMEVEKSKIVDDMDILGIHAYFDSTTNANILDEITDQYDVPILYTEMSFRNVTHGSWQRAEELINILMSILSRNVVGYVDWNLILDSNGGPRFLNFPLDAFIIVNDDFKSFEKQPMFYAMAHFSRYIPPGSIRIDTNICGAHKDAVQSVAYWRIDGKTSIILYNSAEHGVDLTINDENKGTAKITLKPKSLNTIVYSTRNNRVRKVTATTADSEQDKN